MADALRWILPVALLLLPHPSLWAEEKPAIYRPELTEADIAAALGEEWFGLYLAGQKIGWSRSTFEKVGDRYVARMELRGRIKSFGAETVLDGTEVNEFEARPPYRFLGGQSTKTDGKTTQTINMIRTDQGYQVVVTSGKDTNRKTLANLDYILADQLGPDMWIRTRPKVGTSIVSRGFSFEELTVDDTRRTLLSAKQSRIDGVELTIFDVEMHMLKDDVKGSERYDSSGKHLRIEIGGVLEMRLESEKVARDTKVSQDLFRLGMVQVEKALGDPDRVVSLTLEVSGQGAELLKSYAQQSVKAGRNGAVTLRLSAERLSPAPAAAKEIEDALAESVTYPIKHPKVVALAKQAVGDARTDAEKVDRLVRFCNRFIKPSYTAQPLTVLDLLEKKRGDCSEYALLFTTLARASGVPARELSGLVYMGDEEKAFGMHAWNEVLLDGHWVPVDASCNQRKVDATHVCFGHGLRGGLDLAASIGKLKFKVVEVKTK